MDMLKRVVTGLLAANLICAGSAYAASAKPSASAQKPVDTKETKKLSPEESVQQVTDEMMSIIKTGSESLKTNPDRYFQQLEDVLVKTVHFPFVAKFVMGDYWAGASAEQRVTFRKRFQRGMVETIGKGLANYADLKLAIVPSKRSPKKSVAIVNQEVLGAKTPVSISYWMARNKKGQWKLIDVVLDGIKLRDTFRSQFKAEMQKSNNNYDSVIAGWNKVKI